MTSDDMDPLDAYMASLSCESASSSAAATTTAEARSAARTYRARQSAATSASTDAVVRNRRFTRLQQLQTSPSGEDAYFSDEMMQQRSPALFHLHLGQYLNVASRQQRAPFGADGVSLSAFLMDTCDRQVMDARRVAEQRTWGAYASVDDKPDRQDQEEEQEEEEEEEDDEEEETKSSCTPPTDVRLDARRAYLIEIMTQRFLDGQDHEFVDYAAIDGDEALDDPDQMQRDAEERYFDEDD